MIVEVADDVKEIQAKDNGRGYAWPRPDRCLGCSGVRVWGHGFVWAFFDSLVEGLYVRRYRCPCCGCVMRMKPAGYFRGFSVTAAMIRSSVASRLERGSWLGGMGRSRQGNWLRALMRQVMAHLDVSWLDRLLEGFDCLMDHGIVPVRRSFNG
jgi:hypothetical protein